MLLGKPDYVLISISKSKKGEAIEAIMNCIQMIISSLLCMPQAHKSVYKGIITLNDVAVQVMPLTDIFSFNMPNLLEGGACDLFLNRYRCP